MVAKQLKRPRESHVSNDVKKHLRARDWWAFKVVASEHQESGIPDILASKLGYMAAIELKVIDTKRCKISYTEKQLSQLYYMADKAIHAYGLAYVWKEKVWILQRFLTHTNLRENAVFGKLDHVIEFMEREW